MTEKLDVATFLHLKSRRQPSPSTPKACAWILTIITIKFDLCFILTFPDILFGKGQIQIKVQTPFSVLFGTDHFIYVNVLSLSILRLGKHEFF